jgi:hypothetical protein
VFVGRLLQFVVVVVVVGVVVVGVLFVQTQNPLFS